MIEQVIHQLQMTGPSEEQTIELGAGTAVIGRQSGVDILLEHKLVSRRHASVTCTESDCTITDLESANGTKINGKKLPPHEPHPLSDGDAIHIEPFQIIYHQVPVESKPEPSPEPEPSAEEKPEPEPEPVAAPKAPPPLPPPDGPAGSTSPSYTPPPGLAIDRSEYLKYLPDIYHTDFMTRFLAMFESIYIPARWNVDNFDIYLHPQTAPDGFFPWLASWFALTFDHSWNNEQRRTLLTEANELFARRGTKKALSRILEIYTGKVPEIDDTSEKLDPFTFIVKLPLKKSETNPKLIKALINQHKPAHTNYELKLKK
ncbi:MAG: phage tail protein I [Chloroflexi bacterium]|nr:MAG: phage tail protein I [Chloroflexota bacterium]